MVRALNQLNRPAVVTHLEDWVEGGKNDYLEERTG
jgi:hypothetical protein